MEEGTEMTKEKMRIFVGGLGESVTGDDLKRLFASSGMAEEVVIVRTKGRSFAYVDFSPSSINSLSKLFSTYNGCVWKGGMLRLEKAKEHYLVSLKREWAEKAELASRRLTNSYNADEDMASYDKPKKVINSERKQLRIYFPNLRKVKLMPLSGTGKHKYSFQRVEVVHSLPIHFCDCEEHSICHPTAKEKQTCDLETRSDGISEEELNIMNSVMNKLFERENLLDAVGSGKGLAKGRDNSIKSVHMLQVNENEEASGTDEDNLIINVMTRRNNRMGSNNMMAFIGGQGKERISENKESGFIRTQTSMDGQNLNVLKLQKNNVVPPYKRRKSLFNQESNGNGPPPAIPKGNGELKTPSVESAILLGAQLAEPESGIQQSATLPSLSRKSSWRKLLRDRGNNFSISHILPGISSSEEEQLKSNSFVPDSTVSKNDDLVSHGDHLESKLGETTKEELVETQPSSHTAPSTKSSRGASWLQKSSWTQLVGENKSSLFSIAQILPDISYGKQVIMELNDVVIVDSNDSKQKGLGKHDDGKSIGDDSLSLEMGKDESVIRSTLEKNRQTVLRNSEAPCRISEKKHDSASKLASAGNISIGETCSFMRSATSLKEWAKTKATISGSIHSRKSREK
ncbi:hypothetical protein I3842_07G239100 [Carya illinoinensis]|uniref:RRM domain-containing protein n=2 Tax=Carya illinoinensis TaxID=32201 RepID=A0A922ERN7_CARIL|nr:hypothetical protein I3842_07G239100 [Carya illinoinensis]